MELFNNIFLYNIINGCNDLGTPELKAAVATMTEEKKGYVVVFLNCNMEE